MAPKKAIEAGAALVGGHTVDAPELMYGLSVTGIVHPEKFVKNYGARPGEVLILTKNLGIGILTTGLKFDKISDAVLPQLVESMTRLNASASSVMLKHGASACTDVTGYGLLGHASEMAAGNDVRLKIDSSAVPYFVDAPALVAQDSLHASLPCEYDVPRKQGYFPHRQRCDASYSDGGGNIWWVAVLTSR